MLVTAVLFVLMLLILVIPHEFGHMIVAKMCGVQVNEFSVGMGPLIYQKQKGETMYSIRLLPLGGFCAMEGEDEDSDNPRAFNNKTAAQKIAILLAGVFMNVVIAILVCIITFTAAGIAVNTIDTVADGSPAAVAGLEAGDKIIEVDGQKVSRWSDTVLAIAEYQEGDKLEMTVQRDNQLKTVFIVPEFNEEVQRYTIGITAGVSHNIIQTVPYGVYYTKQLNKVMIESFKMLFTGKVSKDELSGPVGLVKIVDQTKANYTSYLLLLALVSLNLAIFNILPFPALDGGRILFVLIRLVTGNAISDEMEGTVHTIGMLLLLGLFVFITFNDILNFF
ncbi:MAG: RIP metalloprotease RseP [Firmicutes bacterium]|nr:RIP metalloprotease RseP [Bacillota bacterium]